jgi:hypothetical protein
MAVSSDKKGAVVGCLYLADNGKKSDSISISLANNYIACFQGASPVAQIPYIGNPILILHVLVPVCCPQNRDGILSCARENPA